MTCQLRAICVMALLAAGCAAGPLNKPIKQGPVATGAGSLAEARKYLEGRWKLVSYQIRPAGRPPIELITGGSGTLSYDGFGNLDMQIRVTDAKIADDLRLAGIPLTGGVLSTTGRTAIDMQAKTLTYVFEGQTNWVTDTSPLSPHRPRHWEVEGNTLTLTTNGSALRKLAPALRDAGLQRVTVSLDSLDDAVFGAMNGIDFPVAKVLDGIDAAMDAGLAPVKVNMVVRRGINETSIVPMAAWARETGVILRFIEYMDVGHSNGWRLDEVVPAEDLVAAIREQWPIEPADPSYRGEVADRWRYLDGGGEFGVISSVTEPFCRDCTRARLSADGKLYTCLFAVDGRDVRATLRGGADDEALAAFLADTWSSRDDRYSELRSRATTSSLPKVEMFAMGG